MTNTKTPRNEIALYGNSAAGFDYLALRCNEFTPDGYQAPVLRYKAATMALFAAVDALTKAGASSSSMVAIYAPDGRMARITLGEVRSFGSLTWEVGPVYVISGEVLAAGGGE